MSNKNIIFTNAWILDCTGALPYHGAVMVEGNKITHVFKESHFTVENNAGMIIDCQGATLMPGLIDPHAHLSFADTATLEDLGKILVEEHTLISMHNARKVLDHGFT